MIDTKNIQVTNPFTGELVNFHDISNITHGPLREFFFQENRMNGRRIQILTDAKLVDGILGIKQKRCSGIKNTYINLFKRGDIEGITIYVKEKNE